MDTCICISRRTCTKNRIEVPQYTLIKRPATIRSEIALDLILSTDLYIENLPYMHLSL